MNERENVKGGRREMANAVKRLTPSDIAPRLEMSRMEVEALIRTGKCPLGEYIIRDGCERGHYHIVRERYERYMAGGDKGATA